MAKSPTKQATHKTPEQTMDELTELSQELGLSDITDNPLVKAESTDLVEGSQEAIQSDSEETNATVAQSSQNELQTHTEPLNGIRLSYNNYTGVAVYDNDAKIFYGEVTNTKDVITFQSDNVETLENEMIKSIEAHTKFLEEQRQTAPVDDKLTLKDAWGRSVPTTLIVIQTVNYSDLVNQVLYAAYLGGELDRTYRIYTLVPYRIRLLLPTENYEKWISKEDQIVYDETVSYNKVLVKSYDMYGFWRNVIKIGKSGAIMVPKTVAQRKPMHMVPVYTRSPIRNTPESRVDVKKIKYTKEELDSFLLEDLKIIGEWYGLPNSNSKSKYVKSILEVQ